MSLLLIIIETTAGTDLYQWQSVRQNDTQSSVLNKPSLAAIIFKARGGMQEMGRQLSIARRLDDSLITLKNVEHYNLLLLCIFSKLEIKHKNETRTFDT